MQNGTPLTFNGNSLQTTNIITSSIEHENMATKLAIPYILAHANGSAIPFSEYTTKMITIKGTIVGNGVADTDSQLDIFRGIFAYDGKNLDIGYAGAYRRYVCTPLTVEVERPFGLSYANFTVTLMCLSAFGTDLSSTTLINTTKTAHSFTDTVTLQGTAPQQLLLATLTLNSMSGAGSLSWGNTLNGQTITVPFAALVAGTVVQIDCVNKQVIAAGQQVDFSGAFPELPPGPVSLTYSDTYTGTPSIPYNVSYNRRFL